MSFADDLQRFAAKTQGKSNALFINVAKDVKASIVDGSAVTGAPGQPVDTGNLKASWQLTMEAKHSALISTNVAYAPVIEDNLRSSFDPRGAMPVKDALRKPIKSTVGGFHSVKLTVGAFDRIVESKLAELGV